MSDSPLQVVCAILINPSNEVLICQRGQAMRNAGEWEFPGGKIETGESPFIALKRELKEELTIQLDDKVFKEPLPQLTHTFYKESIQKSIALTGLIIYIEWQLVSEIMLKEHSAMDWISVADFANEINRRNIFLSNGDAALWEKVYELLVG